MDDGEPAQTTRLNARIMNETEMRLAQAAALDLDLSAGRAEGEMDGFRRLDDAARWVRTQELGFEDPAFFFNALVGLGK